MDEEMSDQEVLFAALDASNYVYLYSFLDMTDPIHQLRKEHKDLERQWNRLRNCKESLMGQHSMDTYLDKYDILEYGFDDHFVERYNLSVMVHDVFMPELDLERCQRGLQGYLKMFRSQLEENVSAPSKGDVWRSVEQLATIVMALYIRQGADTWNLKEMMDQAWFAGEGVGPSPISLHVESTVFYADPLAQQFIQSSAPRAAEDDNRLYGLYQHTLSLIKSQLQDLVDSVDEPSNMELVQEFRAKRVFDLSDHNVSVIQRLDTAWFRNPELAVETAQHATSSQSQDLQSSFPTPDYTNKSDNESDDGKIDMKDRSNDSDSDWVNERQQEMKGVYSPANCTEKATQSSTGDMAGKNDDMISTFDKVPGPHGAPANPIVVDSPQASEDDNTMETISEVREWLDQVSKPREASSHHMDLSDMSMRKSNLKDIKGKGRKVSGSSVGPDERTSLLNYSEGDNNGFDIGEVEKYQDDSFVSPSQLRPSSSKPVPQSLIKKPVGLLSRVQNAIGAKISVKETSDSEFEDDGYVPPLELKRKRSPTLSSAYKQEHSAHNIRSDSQGDKYYSGEGSNNLLHPLIPWSPSPVLSSRSVSPRPVTVKAKRQYRPWTTEEVDRLMELAPRYLYEPSAATTKPRKVHWSRLKKFDEGDGNILKHRSEVMLKDKYREKTDNGRHRQYVMQISKSKSSHTPRYQFPPHDRNNL
ncbi:hypothetical protein BGX27_002949 [Mortierella sp. AM989]|nr:hypothetical protein BGX27_002949 [Mortierella sp. AM989]